MWNAIAQRPAQNGLVALIALLIIVLSGCNSPTTQALTLTPSPGACQHLTPTMGPIKLAGLDYSPYHAGQSPDLGVGPSTVEIQADMSTLKALTNSIRIYSATGPAADIIHAAEANQMQVALGIALGTVPSANEAEITAGEHLATSPAIRAVIVGNEVLTRGDLTEAQLHGYVQRVRAALGRRVPITIADTAGQWLQHRALAKDVDFITVHIYPFWENVSIDCAIQALDREYEQVVAAFPGKAVVIGETGWPSTISVDQPLGAACAAQMTQAATPTPAAGTPLPPGATPAPTGAVASPANQVLYLNDFVTWATQKNVQYFYFDAFDEAWKIHERGVGTHWGLYQQNGQVKPALAAVVPPANSLTVVQRGYEDVAVGGLEAGFDAGIDTSRHQYGWLTAQAGVFTLAYPANQLWGTMFITACKPVPPAQRLFSLDLSAYQSLAFDMRASQTGQCVQVGIKDWQQPDDGSEQKVEQCLTPQWTTYIRPLSDFSDVQLAHVYVVFEVIFRGTASQTIQVRNVRYAPTS